MLANRRTHTMLPVSNLQRAKKFYGEKLGLTPEREEPNEISYHSSGTTWFDLFVSSGASDASFTQMAWDVDDIEAQVAELQARGVVFEQYDTPSFKTVNGIATIGAGRAAWFKDSEGNLLALFQTIR
jgi:catechol 2,3-dioxygenase-like lactoylglutathione lyase family enzyme